MKNNYTHFSIALLGLLFSLSTTAQSYAPAAGQEGSTAIPENDPSIIAWATDVSITRGYLDASQPELGPINDSYGDDVSAFSLGDGGSAILTFESPIANEEGYDFMIIENGFNDTFLELAFVEVSSDGENFFRFPNHSETQTETQVGSFGTLDPTYLHNLAGKYRAGFGTPFDLSDIEDDALLDKNAITHVKIIDVVGSIDENFGSYDSYGNLVNDPFPTNFQSGGFDFRGLGIIHQSTLSNPAFEKDSQPYQVFPVPATNQLTIKGNGDITAAALYDLNGRKISVKQVGDTLFFNVAPGIYMAGFQINHHQYFKRIVIQ